jgi:hypothetical protein
MSKDVNCYIICLQLSFVRNEHNYFISLYKQQYKLHCISDEGKYCIFPPTLLSGTKLILNHENKVYLLY